MAHKALHIAIAIVLISSLQNVYAQNEQVDNINLSDKFYLIGHTLVYDSNLASNPKEQGIREGDDVYLELYILAGNVNTLRVTSNGGVRPQKPSSFDCSVHLKDLDSARDAWELIDRKLDYETEN